MIGIRFVFLKVARFNRCTVEISTRQQIVVRGILNLYKEDDNNEKQKKMTTFATAMLQMRHLANDERNDDVRIRTRVRS